MLAREDENTQELLQTWADVGQKGRAGGVKAGKSPTPASPGSATRRPTRAGIPSSDLAELIQELTDQMKRRGRRAAVRGGSPAARRDHDLKKELRQMMEARV